MQEKRQTIILEGYRNLKHSISGESSQSLRNAVQKYGDAVIFRYKYCPDVNDVFAMNAAKGVVAAEKQGYSEDIYQMIMSSKEDRTEEFVMSCADRLGLDIKLFAHDFTSSSTLNRIEQDIEDAGNSGLKVFPGLTIDGEPYEGAWDNRSVLDTIEKRGGKHVRLAIEGFISWGASAALVLIIATVLALIMVNIGYQELYEHWRHTKLGLLFGEGGLLLSAEHWINDFLMAIFFLMIGLEIKYEIEDGELSSMKRAAMPVIGALGGMLIPAALYVVVNLQSSETLVGWGIPMATDIAFTLGLMALLGSRVPLSLKIFISALAVADDLGAILVIALFYGHGFHWEPFVAGLVVIGLMYYLNRRKTYEVTPYLWLGLVLWFCVFESGLHATLAGVITAIMIPSRGKADLALIAQQTNIIFDRELQQVQDGSNDKKEMGHGPYNVLKNAVARLENPSEKLQHSLEGVVNYFILPFFAFFNTGILVSGMQLDLFQPGNLGILLGLVIGKPLGIVGACWVAAKMKVAHLSEEISWSQLVGASCLAGVGFTMSIVVASSAFSGDLLTTSKVSILIASSISAILGLVVLRTVSKD